MELNCICVKWGTKYPGVEVTRLFDAVRRMSNRDVRFFCLTDDSDDLAPGIEVLPLKADPLQTRLAEAQGGLRRKGGALRKISAFRAGLIPDLRGNLLCLDIDILVTGPPEDLAGFAPNKVAMAAPFKARSHIETKGEGSVIAFDPARHGFLYDDMARKTEEMIAFSQGSEQRYTSFTADRHGALAHFPDGWVVSFLRHCRPRFPKNLWHAPPEPPGARVICFPSHPKADEAVDGHRAGLRSTRPAPWIKSYL